MCDEIDPRPILAILLKNENKPVTIKRLKEVSHRLGKLQEYLYIDISFKSIQNVVELYSNLFKWDWEGEYETIVRADNSDNLFNDDDYIEQDFNWLIPEKIRKEALDILTTT